MFKKVIARSFFVVFPAIIIGFIVSLIFNPHIAAIVTVGFIGLGLHCTSPKSDRGEG